jgi:hypothetical protein
MYSTPRWTCGAPADVVAPQVIPISPWGGRHASKTGGRAVRKGAGVDMEAAIWGRCPGSYAQAAIPPQLVREAIEQQIAKTTTQTAGSAARDAAVLYGPRFQLFRPTGF